MIPPRQPKPAPPPLSLSKLLVVEGDTPMHFCEAMLRHLKLENDIEIRSFGGIGDFGLFIGDLARSADFGKVLSLGVVRDAENDASAALASVQHALTAAGLTPARTPPVQTSIFILPDNRNPGMIETLCMQAVQGEATLAGPFQCVQDFFFCLSKGGVALPALPVLAKNQAQAYLATLKTTQMFPGVAAYHSAWPLQSALFAPLKRFLQSM